MFGGAREYITTGGGSAVNSGARVEGKSAKGKCGNGWAGGSVSLVRVETCLHALHYFLLLTREGGGGC